MGGSADNVFFQKWIHSIIIIQSLPEVYQLMLKWQLAPNCTWNVKINQKS